MSKDERFIRPIENKGLDIGAQTRRYQESGLEAADIPAILGNLSKEKLRDQSNIFEWGLYVNPSDSLPMLERIPNLKGKRIMTVAGSGDIPLELLQHRPKSLEIFDLSRAAVFLPKQKCKP